MTRRTILTTAAKGRRHGMRHSYRIVIAATLHCLPITLAFALVEQESGNGANVWGGDVEPNGGTTGMHRKHVTPRRYHAYRQHGGGAQGVGPAQLTSHFLQDAADRRGGCWRPKHSIPTAFAFLTGLIRQHGQHDGLAAYNAGSPGSPAGQRYAAQVERRQAEWRRRLA